MTNLLHPSVNPLLDALQTLDVSQFSAFSRAKPSTANIPPNGSQKEYLKRHAAESHILLRITGLWISNQIKQLRFSREARYTLETYISASRKVTESASAHSMEDMYLIRKLHEKVGIEADLRRYDPMLFGVPTQVEDIPNGTIVGLNEFNDVVAEIQPSSINDADDIFKRGNLAECFLFGFFYLLDQKCLLEGDRNRGQTIPRFLRIYASHTMNQILFTYFDTFMIGYRECMLQGIPEDQITLAMLAAVMTRGVE